MGRIEVTDLYEAFYRVMTLIWDKPDFRTQGPQKIPSFTDYWSDLEAYLHENLFLAGEVLNIDAVTGGFNFQNAWTGGFLAAQAICSNP